MKFVYIIFLKDTADISFFVNPFWTHIQKGQTYLNKPSAESYRFVSVFMTFKSIPDIKG